MPTSRSNVGMLRGTGQAAKWLIQVVRDVLAEQRSHACPTPRCKHGTQKRETRVHATCHDVTITHEEENLYRVKTKAANLAGIYRREDDLLIVETPQEKRMHGLVWQLLDYHTLKLIEGPDYLGSVMQRTPAKEFIEEELIEIKKSDPAPKKRREKLDEDVDPFGE